jgi:hypothetical protein
VYNIGNVYQKLQSPSLWEEHDSADTWTVVCLILWFFLSTLFALLMIL